jgi:xanthine dehydrogenase accessory factor
VSFAQAVYSLSHEVEHVRAELATTDKLQSVLEAGNVAVIVDPEATVLIRSEPLVVVDAVMAKANTGTKKLARSVVIALGPGFIAEQDVDAVIETMRGHQLGRILLKGSACANTGTPGEIGGRTSDRVLRAPRDGRITHHAQIGDVVSQGEVLMRVEDEPVIAPFGGCLRGRIHDQVVVHRGMKIGDVDPRGDARFVHTVSDKANAVGRAALQAALLIGRERGLFSVLRQAR